MPGATSMVLPTSGRSGKGNCNVEAGAAAVDPGGGDADLLGGPVVVEQALGGVEDVALLHARRGEAVEHEPEIGEVRLVGADVLGSVDGVEGHAEALVAGRKAFAVDVG